MRPHPGQSARGGRRRGVWARLSRAGRRPAPGGTGTVTIALAPPIYTVAPFVAMLLAIAVCPLWVTHWWESNRNKAIVALLLGLPILGLYLANRPRALLAMGEEYVSFIILIGGLYVISGGILLRGDLEATPLTNTTFLAFGAVIASFIGTTGASMLLIRPLLQTNRERTRVKHTVIFFIFLVANIGGMLTPLGDPPLFLGYLRGVPFAWTFRLWPHWLLMVGVLLAAYFVWDSTQYTREPIAVIRRDRTQVQPLRVRGALNALWLAGVVLAVAFLHEPAREVAIVGLAVLSLWKTPEEIRRANGFTYYPIVEVAVLFFGIFLTMIPALEILRARGGELGVREPWQFFWVTGVLSSFLDNAPTYLTFLALGQGLGLAREVVDVPHIVLTGIAVGAVSMGANSYIGNAPNFMVKSIAEETGVRMPSFFGYMLYSGLILVPLFLLVTFLFF
ncbi:MAG TPA: sodium:proton antiporter [Candidatus Rokubacteria bacterium]|nr:sodium:proton antiporter [Candidatus Rokubacteria bacterium]